MIPALIAGAATVLAVLVTTVGQWFKSRDDRQLTLLEVELHSRMPAELEARRELAQVIDARFHRWYEKAGPSPPEGCAPRLAAQTASLAADGG